jgi:hypothetical protein
VIMLCSETPFGWRVHPPDQMTAEKQGHGFIDSLLPLLLAVFISYSQRAAAAIQCCPFFVANERCPI